MLDGVNFQTAQGNVPIVQLQQNNQALEKVIRTVGAIFICLGVAFSFASMGFLVSSMYVSSIYSMALSGIFVPLGASLFKDKSFKGISPQPPSVPPSHVATEPQLSVPPSHVPAPQPPTLPSLYTPTAPAAPASFFRSLFGGYSDRYVHYCANQPMGLRNGKRNLCWGNAFFQAVLRLPLMRNIIAVKYPEAHEQLLIYEQDQLKQEQACSTADTAFLKNILQDGDADAIGQADPTEVCSRLLQERTKGTNLHVRKNVFTFLQTDGHPPPKSPTVKVGHVRCLQGSTIREDSYGNIPITCPEKSSVNLEALIKCNLYDLRGGEPLRKETASGESHNYPVHAKFSQFEKVPPYLFCFVHRYGYNRSTGRMQKIHTRIPIPSSNISFEPNYFKGATANVNYRIKSFIVHEKAHYIAYYREDTDNGTFWFSINDHTIEQIDERIFLNAASKAYLIVLDKE